MGANLSSQYSANISRSISENLNKQLTSIGATTNAHGAIASTIEIVNNGKISCGGDLYLNHDGKVQVTSISAMKSDQVSAMTAEAQQAAENAIAQAVDQANKDWGIGLNVSSTTNKIINETRSTNISIMETELRNTIDITGNIVQATKISIGSNGELLVAGDCSFNNKATVDMTATNMSDATAANIMSSKTAQEVANQVEQVTTQKNQGPNWALIFGIIGGVVVLGVIIFLAVKYGRKGKSGGGGGK